MRRVVVWGTGNMGSTAIRSALAFPGLELVGVLTSTPEKVGRDAASFAGWPVPLHTPLPDTVEATRWAD